jgi:hypothetical protein
LDKAVRELIELQVIKTTTSCPYNVVASHLTMRLQFAAAAARGREIGEPPVDPVSLVKAAIKQIDKLIGSKLEPDGLEDYSGNDPSLLAFKEVHQARHLLHGALEKLCSRDPEGGRIGNLEVQAVTLALASAWRVLVGRLPSKSNTAFHDLLQRVATALFPAADYFDGEAATRKAVKQLKRDLLKPK